MGKSWSTVDTIQKSGGKLVQIVSNENCRATRKTKQIFMTLQSARIVYQLFPFSSLDYRNCIWYVPFGENLEMRNCESFGSDWKYQYQIAE